MRGVFLLHRLVVLGLSLYGVSAFVRSDGSLPIMLAHSKPTWRGRVHPPPGTKLGHVGSSNPNMTPTWQQACSSARRYPTWQLHSAAKSSLEKSLIKYFKIVSFQKVDKGIISAGIFVALDVFFRKLFRWFQIPFPSSLAGCGGVFAVLLVLEQWNQDTAESLYQQLSPGADLLAQWLPVFFVPSLITLPLAHGLNSGAELAKVGIVIIGGFFLTLLSTSYSVLAVQKGLPLQKQQQQAPEETVSSSNVNRLQEMSLAAVKYAETNRLTGSGFSRVLQRRLVGAAIVSGAASILSTQLGLPFWRKLTTSTCLLSTTLASFVYGARLPRWWTKVVHPLVTCTAVTWTVAALLARAAHTSFRSILKTYTTRLGAGNVLLFLLGPAVVSLAASMYSRRQLMKDNLVPVGTAVGVSTAVGLFGTALAVRLLNIGSPFLRLSLLSRNITSPLAMAVASIVGADVSLAVTIVVLTGLIGANFGASILDFFGISDAVARGLGMGAAAHGLGTAAFANERDAFPFAAISMALTACAATITVSIPFLRKAIVQLALGA